MRRGRADGAEDKFAPAIGRGLQFTKLDRIKRFDCNIERFGRSRRSGRDVANAREQEEQNAGDARGGFHGRWGRKSRFPWWSSGVADGALAHCEETMVAVRWAGNACDYRIVTRGF